MYRNQPGIFLKGQLEFKSFGWALRFFVSKKFPSRDTLSVAKVWTEYHWLSEKEKFKVTY